MKKRITVFVISVLLALLVYSLFAVFADWQETWEVVRELGWGLWIPILILSLGNYFLRFLRWVYYLKKIGRFQLPSASHHFLIYLTGFALTTTPGKAGEGLRAFYLKPYGVSFMQSLSALFTERLADLLAIVLLSLLIVWQFPNYMLPAIVVLIVIVAIIPLLSSGKLVQLMERLREKLPLRLSDLIKHLNVLLSNSSTLLSPVLLGKGVSLGVLAWLFEAWGFYYLLGYMGLDIPLATAIAIYSTAVLIGAISFLPGGLGGTEAVMVVLLVTFGVDHSQAVAATLVCRVATLWFAVVLGVLALMVLMRDGFPDWESDKIDAEGEKL